MSAMSEALVSFDVTFHTRSLSCRAHLGSGPGIITTQSTFLRVSPHLYSLNSRADYQDHHQLATSRVANALDYNTRVSMLPYMQGNVIARRPVVQVRPFARPSSRSMTLGSPYVSIILAASKCSNVCAGFEGLHSGTQHPQTGGPCSRREQAYHDWPCS